MLHTFLVQPAIWNITGSHSAAGKTVQLTGKSTVIHQGKKWTIACLLQLENGGTLNINYDVVPCKDACARTPFTATSTGIGKLTGTFTMQDNKIIEDYTTENQQLIGQEIMTMLNENHYSTAGTLRQQGTVKSTWLLDMTKMP